MIEGDLYIVMVWAIHNQVETDPDDFDGGVVVLAEVDTEEGLRQLGVAEGELQFVALLPLRCYMFTLVSNDLAEGGYWTSSRCVIRLLLSIPTLGMSTISKESSASDWVGAGVLWGCA